MVQRPDERYQRAADDTDDEFANTAAEGINIKDGFGIGRERNQPNMSETGFMGGGGGSDVNAIGDFDTRGQGDAGAHRGVGGGTLDYQEPDRNPGDEHVPMPGADYVIDPSTGLSGHISETAAHPSEQLDPAEAASDEHTAAAFPADPA